MNSIEKRQKRKKQRERRVRQARHQWRLRERVEDLWHHAIYHMKENEEDKALVYFKKIVNIDSHHATAIEYIGGIFFNQQNFREAFVHFQKAYDLDKRQVRSLYYMGRCSQKQDPESAYYYIKEFLTLAKISKQVGSDRELLRREKRIARELLPFLRREIALKHEVEISQEKQSVSLQKGKMEDPAPPSQGAGQLELSLKRSSGGVECPSGVRPDPHPSRNIEPLIKTSLSFPDLNRFAEIALGQSDARLAYQLKLEYEQIRQRTEFQQLICLQSLNHVDHYWYQIETVKKVLKDFRGRAILADEVGLGKTIEAGMALKEYCLRGLVRKFLVLVPSGLVSQWREELMSKFSIDCLTTESLHRKKRQNFWSHNKIIASLNIAKYPENSQKIYEQEYDLVIVDEAHHLKNRATQNWKFVNSLKKKFLLLLTATPIHNDLMELYNLVTLVRPGHLKTPRLFKKEHLMKGSPQMPANRDGLRNLLKEVMVRNTRGVVDVKLPDRFAQTISVSPSTDEKVAYESLVSFVQEFEGNQAVHLTKMTFRALLRQAGSSYLALQNALKKLKERTSSEEFKRKIIELLTCFEGLKTEKIDSLLSLLKASGEKKIVFVHYLKTLEDLAMRFQQEGISYSLLHGKMPQSQRQTAVAEFERESSVLLSTDVGSEGQNLQFCHTLVNYDLPWNPMKIEQRVGRIHRIGQMHDVFIFNFCVQQTLEDALLEVLDNKIHMFELVVGEIGSILGNWKEAQSKGEFSDAVFNLWIKSGSWIERKEKFQKLGNDLLEAKSHYFQIKEWDQALFEDEYQT